MEKLIKILEEIKPGVDYRTCENLITDGIFNSFTIIWLVSELEDAYDIEIPAINLVPENFNSAKSILSMVERLKNKV